MPAESGGKYKPGDFLGKAQHRNSIRHLGDKARPHPYYVQVFENRKKINDHLGDRRPDVMEKRLAFAVDELLGTDKPAPEKRAVSGLPPVKQSFGMSHHLFKEGRVGFRDQGF